MLFPPAAIAGLLPRGPRRPERARAGVCVRAAQREENAVGIRETLNDNPRITTAVTIAVIVVVLAFILWPSSGPGGGGSAAPGKLFFTDDDGKTWFPDDASKLPPFDHNGKQAVEAVVYRCDGKTFVNHMKRYTPQGKKMMEQRQGNQLPPDPSVLDVVQSSGMEVKAPGAGAWVKMSDPKASAILQPHCKNTADLEVVLP
jgi:hypothetical protein